MDTPTTPPIDLSGIQVKTPATTTPETFVEKAESNIEAAYSELKVEALALLHKLEAAFGALEKAGHPAVHEAKAQAAVVKSLIKAPEVAAPEAPSSATPEVSPSPAPSASEPATSANSEPSTSTAPVSPSV